jgi:hypothetical protein
MKPNLIYGWPNVKEEHDDVSKIVKKVIKDYTKEKREKDKINPVLPMEESEEMRFEKIRNKLSEDFMDDIKLTRHNKFDNFKTND